MRPFPLELMKRAAEVLPDEEAWAWFLRGLSGPVKRALYHEWCWQAHGGQRVPEGDWRTWLLMAGRGFGKTRAGAEWVLARIAEANEAGTRTSTCPLRIALVGASREEAAKVMVEGPSGLLALARHDAPPVWHPTLGTLRFPGEAEAFLYSGANPEGLRGPEHHFAWCDEIAKWRHADAAWDNLQMGLRLGARPRAVVTTTPRTGRILARLRALVGTVETGGRTRDNAHLPDAFVDWARQTYGGTRLGRQELDGELLEDFEGALFPRGMLEGARQSVGGGSKVTSGGSHAAANLPRETFVRVVVGVDPPVSAAGDECGIVVCGRTGAPEVAFVLEDASAGGLSPEGWARRVAAAAERWRADRVVAEGNQGGQMVEAVLRGAGVRLPVKRVHARIGKAARAEPVAALFETGEAKLAGVFPKLEDQLAGLVAGGDWHGPGSPDRADAMVWAMTELMLARRREPRITFLGPGGPR
jgi:phage terminase large subunit-like protein